MGGSPFLGVKLTATPQLVLYNNPPSSITLGSTFGAAEPIVAEDQPVNRVVYFTGNNIYGPSGGAGAFYAAVGINVYRSLDGGSTWVIAIAIPNIGSGSAKSGLNIVTGLDGLQYMCLVYSDQVNRVRGIRTTNGYTWISDSPLSGNSPTSTQGFTQDTILGDTLYCLATGASLIIYYQVSSGNLLTISGIANEALSRAALCVWDNALYIAGYNTITGARPLYRIIGGVISRLINITTSGTTASTTNKSGMFVDGANLYVFFLQNVSTPAPAGWACYQIDTPGTYNVTNLTSTVISGNMAGSGPGASSRVLTYVDGDSTPGTNPVKYVLYAADGTSPTQFEQFRWNGPNAPMTSIATGGNVTHALTVSKRGSNNGTYTPFGVYPYIISSVPSTSGTVGWRVNFTLWGQLTNPLVSVRLWYGGYDDEYQTQVGVLANPAVSGVPGTPGPVAPNGTLGPNNTSLTGLTVDCGLTLYSFTWVPPASITDVANSRFNFLLEIF